MHFSEALREELSQEIRKFLGVNSLREYRQETDDESPIRLHFTVGKYRPKVTDADLETLSDRLEELLESWDDRLRRLQCSLESSSQPGALIVGGWLTLASHFRRSSRKAPRVTVGPSS